MLRSHNQGRQTRGLKCHAFSINSQSEQPRQLDNKGHLVVRPLFLSRKFLQDAHKFWNETPKIYLGYYQGLIGNQFISSPAVIDMRGMCFCRDKTRSDYVCTVMCPVKAVLVGLHTDDVSPEEVDLLTVWLLGPCTYRFQNDIPNLFLS
jgi:hypothetical protein